MLIVGSGALNEPAIPDLPGLDSFDGDVFHSAQWPADFDATGRNVVVVGTGATAVQVVPQIAAQTERLTVAANGSVDCPPRGPGSSGVAASDVWALPLRRNRWRVRPSTTDGSC